jgi:hypothetical protein
MIVDTTGNIILKCKGSSEGIIFGFIKPVVLATSQRLFDLDITCEKVVLLDVPSLHFWSNVCETR